MQSSVWVLLEYVNGKKPILPKLQFLCASVPMENTSGCMRLLSSSNRSVDSNLTNKYTPLTPEISGVHHWDRHPRSVIQGSSSSPVYCPSRAAVSTFLSFFTLARFEDLCQLTLLSHSGVAFDTKTLTVASQRAMFAILCFDTATGLDTEELDFLHKFSTLSKVHIRRSAANLARFFAATELPNLRELALAFRLCIPTNETIHDALVSIALSLSPSLVDM